MENNKSPKEQLKELLKDYNQNDVTLYLNHVRKLNDDPKNFWIKNISINKLSEYFITINSLGLCLDGEMVILSYRGGKNPGVLFTFSYHAYKNKLLITYPESVIDVQVVRKSDKVKFWKESGKVFYTHNFDNPFIDEEIAGAYCIIKNKRGEFLELLNPADIEKMKASSTMGYIWKEWLSRMILKSVLKRGCKTHFNDITSEIDRLDNESYDLKQKHISISSLDTVAVKSEEVEQKKLLEQINKEAINDANTGI